jgi:hypothetical protein
MFDLEVGSHHRDGEVRGQDLEALHIRGIDFGNYSARGEFQCMGTQDDLRGTLQAESPLPLPIQTNLISRGEQELASGSEGFVFSKACPGGAKGFLNPDLGLVPRYHGREHFGLTRKSGKPHWRGVKLDIDSSPAPETRHKNEASGGADQEA